VLPTGTVARIDLARWQLPPVFAWLRRVGAIETTEMLRTFNCGIGMVAIVGRNSVSEVVGLLSAEGETVTEIGAIEAGDGAPEVVVEGRFGGAAR
jgi:phosphoribosylformylglycinamidine cyclo-ligase